MQSAWTTAGLADGARMSVTAMPVMALFGAAFGAYAAQKGLTLPETALMSALMFAGASQFVAADIWSHPLSAAVIVTLAFVTATVNLRFLLISASLRPWLSGHSPWRTYPALAVLTEPGWIMSERYRAQGGTDTAILLGSGIALWLVWIAATVAGFLLGALVADQKRYGLDLVLPVFFAVMLVPLWQGPRRAMPWAAAGAVALLVAGFVPGSWYIIAGAVAGCVAAGLSDEPR